MEGSVVILIGFCSSVFRHDFVFILIHLDVFEHISYWTYLDVVGHILTYLDIFGNIWTYLDIYLDIFGHIWAGIWTYVDVFGHI